MESNLIAEEKSLTFHNKFVKGNGGAIVAFSVSDRKLRYQQSKGLSWSAEEHQKFLQGLDKFGKGDWKSISRFYVPNRSPSQVASHAQKFFKRQQTEHGAATQKRPRLEQSPTNNPALHGTSNATAKPTPGTNGPLSIAIAPSVGLVAHSAPFKPPQPRPSLSLPHPHSLHEALPMTLGASNCDPVHLMSPIPSHSEPSTLSQSPRPQSQSQSLGQTLTQAGSSDESDNHSWHDSSSGSDLSHLVLPSQPNSELFGAGDACETQLLCPAKEAGLHPNARPLGIPSLHQLLATPPIFKHIPNGMSLYSPVLMNHPAHALQSMGAVSQHLGGPAVAHPESHPHSSLQDKSSPCQRCDSADKRVQEMEKTILELRQEIWELRRKSFMHS